MQKKIEGEIVVPAATISTLHYSCTVWLRFSSHACTFRSSLWLTPLNPLTVFFIYNSEYIIIVEKHLSHLILNPLILFSGRMMNE